MTTFWWVRHGPTHERALTGHRDVPVDLSDAPALRRLDGFLPPDAPVVSSDLRRAAATADAIQGARARLPHDPDLREFDFGEWDGMLSADVARLHPDLSREYWERPGDAAPPGGESWREAEARVARAAARLRAAGHRDVIVVAHLGVILSQLGRARGVAPGAALAQRIRNLSVTRIPARGAPGPVDHLP